MDSRSMLLLDRLISDLERLQPRPAPNRISEVVRSWSRRLSIPNEDLTRYLIERNLPPAEG